MRKRGNRLDVEHVAGGVANRLAVERLRVLADGGLPGVRIVGIHPRQLHVHLAQHVLELVDRAAVEGGRRHHVVARLKQGEQCRRLRGNPAREGHGAAAPFEVGHALLEDRDGRVHDARVGVPVLLEVEVRRGRFGILEHVAGRLVDRHRTRAGVRVGALAGVHLARFESEFAGFFHAAGVVHAVSCIRPTSRRLTREKTLDHRASGAPPLTGSNRGRRAPRSRAARPPCRASAARRRAPASPVGG